MTVNLTSLLWAVILYLLICVSVGSEVDAQRRWHL